MLSRALFSALAAFVLALFTHGHAAADEAVTLAWKFNKGEKLHYVVEQKMSTEGKIGGQTIKNDVEQTIDVDWDIDDVAADGTAQMTQIVSRVRLKVTSPGGPGLEYDSSSKEAPQPAAAPVAGVFKAMVGKRIKMKMSALGKISDVTLPEGMAEELKNAPAQGPAKAMLNEESFKQMTGASTLEFADHPVKKGDTWQRKTSMSNPAAGGKQTTEVTYTYQGREEQSKKQIDKIELKMKTAMEPAGGLQIEVKDQKSEGEIDFDHTAGHVMKSHAKVKMAMVITVMGQKIDQDATNETTMRLADGGDKSADDEK